MTPTSNLPLPLRALRAFVPAPAALLAAATIACGDGASSTGSSGQPFDASGQLETAVQAPTLAPPPLGVSAQRMASDGRFIGVFLPTDYDPARQWPLTVMLHGSTGSGEGMALTFEPFAQAAGVVIIAPNARGFTWDRLMDPEDGSYGPDVAHIDEALEWAFQRISVDPARVSMSGFSDGATYTILVGLKNGNLFSRVAAFTPCATVVPGNRRGNPLVFISHGLDDIVLPIDDCSRATVPALRQRGYNVEFVEYPSAQGNGHYITQAVATQGLNWLAGR